MSMLFPVGAYINRRGTLQQVIERDITGKVKLKSCETKQVTIVHINDLRLDLLLGNLTVVRLPENNDVSYDAYITSYEFHSTRSNAATILRRRAVAAWKELSISSTSSAILEEVRATLRAESAYSEKSLPSVRTIRLWIKMDKEGRL